jgi:hypothetical protein
MVEEIKDSDEFYLDDEEQISKGPAWRIPEVTLPPKVFLRLVRERVIAIEPNEYDSVIKAVESLIFSPQPSPIPITIEVSEKRRKDPVLRSLVNGK